MAFWGPVAGDAAVIHGGSAGGLYFNDVWKWNNAVMTWTFLSGDQNAAEAVERYAHANYMNIYTCASTCIQAVL